MPTNHLHIAIAIAGFSALVISVITFCVQIMKIATANPVQILKTE